jgi:hypothetical protein
MRPGLKKKYVLMGQIVTVNAHLKRNKNRGGGWVRWEVVKPDYCRAGWVVGFGVVYDGKIKSDLDDLEAGIYGQPYFVHGKTHHVLHVTYWPTIKPIIVLPEDVTPGGQPEPPGLWTPGARESLSLTMKSIFRTHGDMPRNKDGRFTKG